MDWASGRVSEMRRQPGPMRLPTMKHLGQRSRSPVLKQPVEAAPGTFLRKRRILAEQLSGRLIVHPKSEVPRCWLGRQSHQWRSQFLPREAPASAGESEVPHAAVAKRNTAKNAVEYINWEVLRNHLPFIFSPSFLESKEELLHHGCLSVELGWSPGSGYPGAFPLPFESPSRTDPGEPEAQCLTKLIPRWDVHLRTLQTTRRPARLRTIPLGPLFRHRQFSPSKCTFHLGFSLDSPPGSGHMKQSRDRGTQKSINRMENASNRAGIVEISTLVEGKGERGKTGEVVQRWNPLAAGIWLPATVARILDASPARGHEAKPVPKDLHCTRSLQVNPGDCRNAKIKSGNGGVNPGLIVCQGSGPGPALHTAGGSGPLLGSRTLYQIRRVNLRLRG